MAYSYTEKKRIRKDFGTLPKVMDVPYLLAIQLDSYRKFTQQGTPLDLRGAYGLHAAFKSVFPIVSYSGNAALEYVDYNLGIDTLHTALAGPITQIAENAGFDGAVVAQFIAEQQALAVMSHPNIAKIFDAGETSWGAPYFVMELVRGVPITDYCDEYSLSTRERLELFVDICHAVQHAHQKGIIHRDLKSENFLFSSTAANSELKMIDFGLSKIIKEEVGFQTLTKYAGSVTFCSCEMAILSVTKKRGNIDLYSNDLHCLR